MGRLVRAGWVWLIQSTSPTNLYASIAHCIPNRLLCLPVSAAGANHAADKLAHSHPSRMTPQDQCYRVHSLTYAACDGRSPGKSVMAEPSSVVGSASSVGANRSAAALSSSLMRVLILAGAPASALVTDAWPRMAFN